MKISNTQDNINAIKEQSNITHKQEHKTYQMETHKKHKQ